MGRSRVLAMLVGAVALVVMISWLRVWADANPAQIGRADYTATYVAATQWREGQGDLVYDRKAQLAAGARLGIAPAQLGNPFVNPPSTLPVAAPFSFLDLLNSYRAWSLTQLLLLVAAVLLVTRAAPWPRGLPAAVPIATGLLTLAGAGVAMTVLQGQWDGVSALGLAAAYACWRGDRRATGGFVLAALLLLGKPHLALGLAAWVLGRRDRRMLTGAAAGALLVATCSLVLVGPAACLGFLSGHVLTASLDQVRMMLGFTGLFGSWFGDSPLSYVLATIAGLTALGACYLLGASARRSPQRLEASLAGAVLLSLLVAPHMLVQDLALIGLPLIWCSADAAVRDGATPWPGRRTLMLIIGWVTLDLAARIDIGNFSPAPPGRLVPWLLIAAAITACVACGIFRLRVVQRKGLFSRA
jgi:hypothetical protein